MMDYGSEQDGSEVCARRIQECWRSHHNRNVFKLLMKTLRSAEECWAPALLRQFSPKEANLLKDPSLQCKVRIRFSGPQFPPVMVFKIFHTGGGSYLSGKALFQPSNEATAHTCRMMGNRKFIHMMLEDQIHWQGQRVSQPADITCKQDYMQYSSHLDELPACVGGRENGWRRLTPTVMSRGGGGSKAHVRLLGQELTGATAMRQSERPIRSPVAPPSSAVSTPEPQTPKRRSSRARTLADRLRHIYTPPEQQRVKTGSKERTPSLSLTDKRHFVAEASVHLVDNDVSDCTWEEEAELLCSWSNQLTVD